MPKNIPLLVKKSDSDDEIRIDDSVEGDNSTEEYITLSSEQKEDLIDKLESKKHNIQKTHKKPFEKR